MRCCCGGGESLVLAAVVWGGVSFLCRYPGLHASDYSMCAVELMCPCHAALTLMRALSRCQKVGKENEGLQMKFTIGKYYTPSGRCIQSKVYTSKGDGQLGTDEAAILNQDRAVFFTDHGRQVQVRG